MFVDDKSILDQLSQIEKKIGKSNKKDNLLKNSLYIFSAIILIGFFTFIFIKFDISEIISISWEKWLAICVGSGILFLIIARVAKESS